MKNVYEQWASSGFAWEQYNPDTGKGQRTQHFTGWTSLVVKIMGLPDLSDGKMGFNIVDGVDEEDPAGVGKTEEAKGGKDEL